MSRQAAASGPFLFHNLRGGFGKARYALGAAFLGEWMTPLAGQLAVGPRLLACLGQRNQRDAVEPEVALPAADDETLDPAPGSARLDEEVESIAVAMPARRARHYRRYRREERA